MVKNLPSSVEDVALMPSLGTKTQHAEGQLSCNYRVHMLWNSGAITREKPACPNEDLVCHTQLRPNGAKNILIKKEKQL